MYWKTVAINDFRFCDNTLNRLWLDSMRNLRSTSRTHNADFTAISTSSKLCEHPPAFRWVSCRIKELQLIIKLAARHSMSSSCQLRTHNSCKLRTHNSCKLRTHNSCQLRTHNSCKLRTHNSCKLRTHNSCKLRTHNSCKLRTNNSCKLRTHNSCSSASKLLRFYIIFG